MFQRFHGIQGARGLPISCFHDMGITVAQIGPSWKKTVDRQFGIEDQLNWPWTSVAIAMTLKGQFNIQNQLKSCFCPPPPPLSSPSLEIGGPLYGSVLRSEGSGGTLAYETAFLERVSWRMDYNDEVEVGSFSVSSYNTVIEAVEHFMEVQDVSLGAVANQATKIPVILVISPPEDVGP
nr:hypothetical protein Iba_chr07fCG5920 [Ipomoea batatas]